MAEKLSVIIPIFVPVKGICTVFSNRKKYIHIIIEVQLNKELFSI